MIHPLDTHVIFHPTLSKEPNMNKDRTLPSGDGQHLTQPGDPGANQSRRVNLWHPERVTLAPERRIATS